MFYGAADAHDGSIVLAGATGGSWKGTHAGGANDFAAVKLDADGGEVWRWQVTRAGALTRDAIRVRVALLGKRLCH